MATLSEEAGLEALRLLMATEPPVWLAPSPSLSQTTRAASEHLFASLNPFAPKSPFDKLLTEGFDAEQIWQQIDLQANSLLPTLRREVKRFEKSPEVISKLSKVLVVGKKDSEGGRNVAEKEVEDFDDDLDDFDEQLDEEEEEEEEADEERDSEGEEEAGKGGGGGVEDKFLKIKELEEFLDEDEAREYGLKKKDKKGEQKFGKNEDEDDEEEDEDEDEEDDELGHFGLGDDEDADKLASYEDFFGAKKGKVPKQKPELNSESEDSDMGSEQEYAEAVENQQETVSTHEKELEKLRSKIRLMEKANLDPKAWTMQGEVTAAKRPLNSALEVDLDFEHNVKPAPVITEEVTFSLEDMIKKGILEGRFDDVRKAFTLPSKASKEIKELDENKSKKGLAEIYEEEYVQKTDMTSAPLSFKDEKKKEASVLFKKLCLKLDALSHFHFTPKPVIEDMTIQTNVPALAMEEIAPVAVSDAAMLAPEEVFAGKGDIKEEVELTQADRKRRRANKKRKFKAEAVKLTAKKARDSTSINHDHGKEE
ncbi:U3 small nucleolar ribonucleoprotein protein MPP10 [Juglans regia]|uniref:U3 small nucleolar ribonucleoprotein protein MPP10 n=2 Tax=Juglans regia TaxID=51240 RepID=A0A2I4EPF4_JUGRE|nr:U3 small nucleolar ribonucleoprotein protein MPP10 [Juglans regia]